MPVQCLAAQALWVEVRRVGSREKTGHGFAVCRGLAYSINGTVALRVDIIAVQEIFRLAVASSAHAAVLSD